MDEISYSWEPHYDLERVTDGGFVLNKLFIAPDFVSYKTQRWELAPGVFEKLEAFYELLQDHHGLQKS